MVKNLDSMIFSPCPQKEYDVVAIGQALVDITAKVDEDFLKKHKLEKGMTSHVGKDLSESFLKEIIPIHYSAGSTAANTLSGLSCLGSKTAYIARVGDDDLGRIFVESLSRESVEFKGSLMKDSLGTGRCIVLITPDADRTMVTYLGAAHHFSSKDYDEAILKKAKVVLVEAYQLETPRMFKVTQEAIQFARKAGAFIVLSAANPVCLHKHRGAILDFLKHDVDLFMGNAQEFCALSHQKVPENALREVGSYVPTAVMTAGAEGSYLCVNQTVYHISPPHADTIVDTCGAGDQYLAGFLYALVQPSSLKEILQSASVMSKSVLMHSGARPLGSVTLCPSQRQKIAVRVC